jgi:xylulokinase
MGLLGIDLGSSSVKGVIFDYGGRPLASASKSYETLRPAPDAAEADANRIWEAAAEVIRELAGGREPVEALAVSSHGETTIPIDAHGEPAGHAMMNSDNRAVREIRRLVKEVGERELYAITGVPAHPMFAMPKIMWLKKHRPDVYAKTVKFLSVGDFILSKLGAGFLTDPSMADRTFGFDIARRTWSEDILSAAGLKKEQFPEVTESGKSCGIVPDETARALGLKTGVVLALAGHDQPCGAYGSGAYRGGDAAVSAGTYECVNAVTAEPGNNDKAFALRANSYPHVVPGTYINLGFFPAGFSTKWFVDEFCHADTVEAEKSGVSVYEYLGGCMEESPPGQLFLPYLIGSGTPYWDPFVRGALLGITPGTSRHDVFRAIFEGIAYELKLNIDNLESIGIRLNDMVISGGNSRLDFSVQLRADVTGRRFARMDTPETVCKGAAMLAGVALGVYADYEDAVTMTAAKREVFAPRPEMTKRYEKPYAQYKKIYHAIRRIQTIR